MVGYVIDPSTMSGSIETAQTAYWSPPSGTPYFNAMENGIGPIPGLRYFPNWDTANYVAQTLNNGMGDGSDLWGVSPQITA